MSESKLISIETICIHYEIEQSFLRELNAIGLLQMAEVEQKNFIDEEEMRHLEKIIRLHQELDLNLEAIDVVFNLLEKQEALRKEISMLKSRLSLYE